MFNALVIDDDVFSRAVFNRALRRLGCNVREAETAERGMSQLSSMTFNIVFAALCIKNIGARGLARWIKANMPDTKFFIITSWKGKLEKSILAYEGIDGVIHKPILFAEIRDILLEKLG